MSLRFLRFSAFAGVAILLVSLAYPVFDCRGEPRHMGYELAWAGWMGLMALDPRWFANPLALLVFIAVFRNRALKHVVLYSSLILTAALSCLVVPAMACGSGAGGPDVSTALEVGGYLWVVSMSVLAITGFAWHSATKTTNSRPPYPTFGAG